jgi:hypothetical protein
MFPLFRRQKKWHEALANLKRVLTGEEIPAEGEGLPDFKALTEEELYDLLELYAKTRRWAWQSLVNGIPPEACPIDGRMCFVGQRCREESKKGVCR